MSDLETLKMGVNIQNVVVSLLEMFEKRVDALEESRDKKEFVINRRICEELMPAIWVTIDRSGYNFPSEFNEAIRKVEDRFDDISDKLTERFSKGEETETEFDWMKRDSMCTFNEDEIQRMESERDETLKKECEKLQNEVEDLRKQNEQLTEEIEQYKRKIASIRYILGVN